MCKKLSERFNEFIIYCRAKNLANSTIEDYDVYFKQFMKFYQSESFDITEQTINEYIIWMQTNTRQKDTSIQSSIRHIRTILYYFMRLGYLDNFLIKLPKAEETIKEVYTDEELTILLKKPNVKKCRFSEYRNWVAVNFFLATGIRKTSLINIKIQDVDFNSLFIRILKNKNKRLYSIPMSLNLFNILVEYLNYRKGSPEDYLFCTEQGTQLTLDSITSAMKRYNIRRGVMKTSTHLYRHTFAKKWILAGGDIFRLQRILNHKGIEVVKQYANMFSADLQKDFCKFNALDNILPNSNKRKINMRGGENS